MLFICEFIFRRPQKLEIKFYDLHIQSINHLLLTRVNVHKNEYRILQKITNGLMQFLSFLIISFEADDSFPLLCSLVVFDL